MRICDMWTLWKLICDCHDTCVSTDSAGGKKVQVRDEVNPISSCTGDRRHKIL